MSHDRELLDLLNAAGFAFQLGVERSLQSAVQRKICQVQATEHPWRHEERGDSGFIDIVIQRGIGHMVVECKRTKNAKWLFLVPKSSAEDVARYRCLWYASFGDGKGTSEWSDIVLAPSCPESSFCCIRGTGEGQNPLLDRIGSEMILATEALLNEVTANSTAEYGVFFPVLVTNAEMYVAYFDPSEMDLSTGTIESCEFASAGVVRYRKALDASRCHNLGRAAELSELNEMSQRSILVVSAREFSAFVESMKIPPDPWNYDYPWVRAAQDYRRRKLEPN